MSDLFYRGQSIDELTKEELIEALEFCYDYVRKSQENYQEIIRILGDSE